MRHHVLALPEGILRPHARAQVRLSVAWTTISFIYLVLSVSSILTDMLLSTRARHARALRLWSWQGFVEILLSTAALRYLPLAYRSSRPIACELSDSQCAFLCVAHCRSTMVARLLLSSSRMACCRSSMVARLLLSSSRMACAAE